MRLLKVDAQGQLTLTKNFQFGVPPYAVLSHTWDADEDEVFFSDLVNGTGIDKSGYQKLLFCGNQAHEDHLDHFWVDTCCIDKSNSNELTEAINSMFRWYANAAQCYALLSDVPSANDDELKPHCPWESAFRSSRWFTRGWTLQELIAPSSVKFFSQNGKFLGNKSTLGSLVQEVTQIPLPALQQCQLSRFSIEERLKWASRRSTTKPEDKAYCLFGLCEVFLPLIYGEGDNAFKRLREALDKRSESSFESSTAHIRWMVDRQPNPLFTGRDNLLQQLEHDIRNAVERPPNNTGFRIVISGIGGQGKSEICLQLANHLRHLFWVVFWIDVSTTNIAERSFSEVALSLSLPARTWEEARRGIANLSKPWLLILDNADDPRVDYQRYFPGGPLGVVLLTSRNSVCQQYASAQPVALEGLADTEAQDLLLKAARVSLHWHMVTPEEIRAVANLLQSHPLALIQAGAFISCGHCTVGDYPYVYERQRQRLLAFKPDQAQSRYRDVYTTFEASAEFLKNIETEAARDALQLLPTFAVCGFNRFPFSVFETAWKNGKDVLAKRNNRKFMLLTTWHVDHLPSSICTDGTIWDSFRLMEAVELLKKLALVSTDLQNDRMSLSMHPLIHAWARDRQNSNEQQENWLRMGCLLALSHRNKPQYATFDLQLQPHLEALVERIPDNVWAADQPRLIIGILINCAWMLHDMQSDAKVAGLLQTIFNKLGLGLSNVDQQWTDLYHLQARNLMRRGKSGKAISILKQLVAIAKQSTSEVDTALMLQHQLGAAYSSNGQLTEAIALFEKIVETEAQLSTGNRLDRLASEHELARAYWSNGQLKQATPLLEQIVQVGEQLLAKSHPRLLKSRHALAMAYRHAGRLEEAQAIFGQLVTIMEQSMAQNHPFYLTCQHPRSVCLWKLGRHEEALTLMVKVVEMRKQVLDQNHPDLRRSEKWLRYMERKTKDTT